MPSSSPLHKPMEKANQDPHPLKCPRCDSSNTKFCYYNNYSLSQPRHFCKACKRYWTRGGTLRNVPVGGGCRKNKRSKRPGADALPATATATATTSTTVQRPIDLPSAPNSNRIHNPMFYNPVHELNFPFSSGFRVSSDHNSGFDLHSQMNGFSSGLVETDHHHQNGFKPMIQDHAASFSSNYHNSIFFGSSNLASTSTMASLLAMKGVQGIPGLMPYDDPGKDVKMEGENKSVWNPNPNQSPNPMDQSDPSSSSSSLLWNNANLCAWFDPSNMGSSVPSLI
ncbi:hypothetical protein ACS0TY_032129 [Phlomoides rotata]